MAFSSFYRNEDQANYLQCLNIIRINLGVIYTNRTFLCSNYSNYDLYFPVNLSHTFTFEDLGLINNHCIVQNIARASGTYCIWILVNNNYNLTRYHTKLL